MANNPLIIICFCLLAAAPAFAQSRMVEISIGTGFFVNDQGYLITNNHVVNRCKKYTVYGANTTARAELLARDATNDLALLKTPFSVAEIGRFRSEEYPLVKDEALQIVGFPGNAWKKRKAVVRRAEFQEHQGPQGENTLLQFSDSVAQGNSGGPLLDEAGNVVGVIVAKSTITQTNLFTREVKAVKRSDVAINLPTVWRLLSAYKVPYATTTNTAPLSQNQITEKAKRFIVNIRCVVE